MLFGLFASAEDQKTNGMRRSPRWRTFERRLIEAHPYCAVCGTDKDLVGHHIQPFHLFPALELDPSNILIVCESRGKRSCHFAFGHYWDWSKYNPDVVAQAAAFLAGARRARVSGF